MRKPKTNLESTVLHGVAEEAGLGVHHRFVNLEHFLLAGNSHVEGFSSVEKPMDVLVA